MSCALAWKSKSHEMIHRGRFGSCKQRASRGDSAVATTWVSRNAGEKGKLRVAVLFARSIDRKEGHAARRYEHDLRRDADSHFVRSWMWPSFTGIYFD